MSSTSSSDRKPWCVRTQLLLAVNVPLGIVLVVLLAWDYRREISQAAETKRENLANEAVAIHRAVSHLLAEGDRAGVQSYINSVCHQMRAAGTPYHAILVETPKDCFFSHSADEKKRKLLDVLRKAALPEVAFDGRQLIVGRFARPDLSVYVVESLTTVRRQVRKEVFGRLMALAVVGLIAMLLVNMVVLRIINRPVGRLVRAVERIRAGDYLEPEGSFSTCEFTQLADALSLMSNTLRDNEQQRKTQMEKAREIQRHLLPTGLSVPGLSLAVWFAPAERVAGDYYDIIPAGDGSWLIALADISGHGVPAALEAAMLKVLLEHAVQQTQNPADILQRVNRHFVEIVPEGDFASFFLLRWIPEQSRMEYANAGHIPGLFRRQESGIAALPATGSLLGIDKDDVWELQTLSIEGGESLLIVSDGVMESRSPRGDLFGQEALQSLFESAGAKSPEQFIGQLREKIADFTENGGPTDDITALAIRFNGTAKPHETATAHSGEV